MTQFNSLYGTSQTVLNTCNLCHTSGSDLNQYGLAFKNMESFEDIVLLDSDGDGFYNIDEINARTFPGDPGSFPAISNAMQVPSAGPEVFFHAPSDQPVLSTEPWNAAPVGVGPVASGGTTLTVTIRLARLSGPVDIYAAFEASSNPETIVVLQPDMSFHSVSLDEILQSIFMDMPLPAGMSPWLPGANSAVDTVLFSNIPMAALAPGHYTLYLMVTPPGDISNFYLWGTAFTVGAM